MVGVGDPVRAGLVASLARPGGNLTGNTVVSPDLGAKRLQLLREAIARVSRVAYLVNEFHSLGCCYGAIYPMLTNLPPAIPLLAPKVAGFRVNRDHLFRVFA